MQTMCSFLYSAADRIQPHINIHSSIPNKALFGHLIRTEKVVNEDSCHVKCYLEPNCVSINVGPEDEGKRTCELNNATDESLT